MAEEKQLSFEQAVEKLEKVVGKLEQGDVSLEEALADFQKGVLLLQLCNNRLQEAEAKMKLLVDDNGEIKMVPMDEME